jgi:hypothetical protein
MAGITGQGTTFNLPNYVGELFALSRETTPFLSAIGGLSGGRSTTATEFEWQTFDLRDASGQRQALEGANAPTAEARVRANVRNVVEVHHEAVEVSYTKQATTGQIATPASAPYRGVPGSNPVADEMGWQVAQGLKQMARDINFAFINGTYSNPTTNATARKTRGLIAAITSNVTSKATYTSAALSAATDTITETTTPRADGDKVVFTDVGASTGIFPGRVYFVVSKATNTFKVAATAGGTAITIGTATVSYIVPWTTDLTNVVVEDLVQQAWDGGGVAEESSAVFVCNSTQRRALSVAYANAYLKADPLGGSRNVGGVSVDTIRTDFGTFGILVDQAVPKDALILATLDQIAPVFLQIPGKGFLFEEPLAKVGSADRSQLYGEVGLEYGNQAAHGIIRGLKV